MFNISPWSNVERFLLRFFYAWLLATQDKKKGKDKDDKKDTVGNNTLAVWLDIMFIPSLKLTAKTPKNRWLEYYFHIGEAYFQVRTVSFREGSCQGCWFWNHDGSKKMMIWIRYHIHLQSSSFVTWKSTNIWTIDEVVHIHSTPVGSMRLVYLPTFTIQINHSCRWIYRSSHGSYGTQWSPTSTTCVFPFYGCCVVQLQFQPFQNLRIEGSLGF